MQDVRIDIFRIRDGDMNSGDRFFEFGAGSFQFGFRKNLDIRFVCDFDGVFRARDTIADEDPVQRGTP